MYTNQIRSPESYIAESDERYEKRVFLGEIVAVVSTKMTDSETVLAMLVGE